ILAWAHGTTGLGDQCSLTTGLADGSAPDLTIARDAVGQGFTVVVPDYQGLGTPGDHAYLVGQAEGRNVLDGTPPASRRDGAGAGRGRRRTRSRWCGAIRRVAGPPRSRPSSSRPTRPTSTSSARWPGRPPPTWPRPPRRAPARHPSTAASDRWSSSASVPAI